MNPKALLEVELAFGNKRLYVLALSQNKLSSPNAPRTPSNSRPAALDTKSERRVYRAPLPVCQENRWRGLWVWRKVIKWRHVARKL